MTVGLFGLFGAATLYGLWKERHDRRRSWHRWSVDPVNDEVFDSPEAAALVDYPPNAHARVVNVRYKRRGKEAVVEITTDPDYPYFIHVERTASGWVPTLGHN